MKTNKIKILFVLSNLTLTNGVSSFLINYLKNMNLEEFDIDIMCSDFQPANEYLEFFKSKNIAVHFLPYIREKGLNKYLKALKIFFKENHNYDIVYSNVANQACFVFKYAKKYKIPVRAIHSHATQSSDSILGKIRNSVLNYFMLKNATHKFACSELAGKALFGNKANFDVINNAIDYTKFQFNQNFRKEIRKEYNINDKITVIGFIGRFAPQKNIYFFQELAKKLDENYRILMIGTGDLKESFVKSLEVNNLKSKFIFIDETNEVYKYYSAMDIFCLPSLFEGLPVVGVEAQANGLPCLFSNNITRECKLVDSTCYLPLNVNEWVSKLRTKMDRAQINEIGEFFDIKKQSVKFEKILKRLLEY